MAGRARFWADTTCRCFRTRRVLLNSSFFYCGYRKDYKPAGEFLSAGFSFLICPRAAGFLVAIRVIVAPGPVFALLGRRQLAEIAIRPVGFADPLPVIDDFVIVPDVIIVVVRIVNTDGGAFGAARKQHW